MTGANDHDVKLKREAIAWVRRLTSGQATAADAEAFMLWRRRSGGHEAAFASAIRLWRDLEPAGRSLRLRGEITGHRSSRRGVISRRALVGGGLAAASAVGAYAIIHPPLALWPSLAELTADYRTATGEQRSVALSDDVSVRLNTQTSIAVRPSDDGIERVELITGEASFSASLASGRSLAVRAADSWITAHAGKFDIRYLRGQKSASVCVTCIEGELNVERGAETTLVSPGQQLRYDSLGFKPITAIDPNLASAWERGILIFRFTPLEDVVEEINRYRPGRIVIVNADIAGAPVSGRFRIDRMDEILTRIEQAFGATVRSLPGGLVLLS